MKHSRTPSTAAPTAPAFPIGLHAIALACLVGMASLTQLALAQTPAQPAQVADARTLNLPAQALPQTVGALARQFGVAVGGEASLLEGKQAPALQGRFSLPEALASALSGSGLQAVRGSGGGYAIVAIQVASTSASAPNLLPGVVVTAPSVPIGTTERTGSYTPQVTRSATRLPLSLRETPQSVTVVTSQQLEDRGIIGLAQALDTVTGIHITSDVARPQVYSRGLTANLQVEGSPMVPSHQATTGMQSDNLVAYDRIEVLRGANGLLSGTGEPSGTISLVRKRATRDFQAHVQGGLGSWNNRFADADVSGPLNAAGTLRARVAAGLYDGDNFIRDNGRDGKALLATVEADLTPHTTLRIGYQHDKYQIEGSSGGSTVPLWYSDGTPYNAPRSLGTTPREKTTDHLSRNIYAGLEHTFGNGWEFQGTVDLARRENIFGPANFYLSVPSYPDPSGIGTNLASPFVVQREDRQWAYSFDLQGPLNLFGREHQLLLGGSGWDRERDLMQAVIEGIDSPAAEFAENFPTAQASSWSLSAPYYIAPFPQNRAYTEQHGLYAAARWNLADTFKLITGLRMTNWKTWTNRYNSATGEVTASNTAAYAVRREITPYVGAVWDFHPNVSAYASYADVFQPQNLYDANDNLLEPIVGKNYEAGVKGEFFDNQLNASAAVFRVVQDNLGERDPNFDDQYLTPGGNTPYRSVGKGITTKGFETEVSGSPRPGWNISAGYTYAQSKDSDGDPYDRNQPEHLLRVFTTYRLLGAWSGLTLGGGVNWNSEISQTLPRPIGEYQANGQPVTADHEFRQGSVWRVNAMARYEFNPRLSLLLNVDNLFDKKYYSYIASWGSPVAYYGQPRRWRATLRYQY